jgi:hypothetical protein
MSFSWLFSGMMIFSRAAPQGRRNSLGWILKEKNKIQEIDT